MARKKPNVYDIMESKIRSAILASGQKESFVDYSVYDTDEDDNPIDNLDEIAFQGIGVLVGFADDFWGGKDAVDFTSEVLDSPTWLQVCVEANRMIQKTNDYHHVFLEGLSKRKNKRKDGVTEYEFDMGS